MGGIKPYIYLDMQQINTSSIAVHYYKWFKSWFDFYWSVSKTVAYVQK
jgi:hypothetical protein